jgi:hypothetical protein
MGLGSTRLAGARWRRNDWESMVQGRGAGGKLDVRGMTAAQVRCLLPGLI